MPENNEGVGIIMFLLLIGFIWLFIYIVSLFSKEEPIPTIGSPCITNKDCPGLTCSNRVCAIAVGGDCSNNTSSCASESKCIDGVCKT